ncbi:MAG: 2-phosphosulfolactate phosphatase [Anaerolineales bacterium]|nr:2-phosphosulfolactate phosphatase [Anaerolineales bacterium]
MEIQYATLVTCGEAVGTVVVIDVLRAFSTAAYAFAAGASEIVLVSAVEEAFALRERFPGALLVGEIGGRAIQGFDFSNSPSQLANLDLAGRLLIQRTSAGTQGVVRSARAENLLASSFVCARSTASYIRSLAPQQLTFVITGAGTDQSAKSARPGRGDEDAACAEYISSLLQESGREAESFLGRVRASLSGRALAASTLPDFPPEDLEYCLSVDRFDFALPVQRRDGLLVMQAIRMSPQTV